jgi:hypothetical protein
MLQTILPEKIESIFLANPSVAPEDVLHAIAFELQLKLPKNADRLKVMQVLQTHLLARHAAGKQVVIFVEEAQGMPLATANCARGPSSAFTACTRASASALAATGATCPDGRTMGERMRAL